MVRFLISALAILQIRSGQSQEADSRRCSNEMPKRGADVASPVAQNQIAWATTAIGGGFAPAQPASSRLAHFLVRRRRPHRLVLFCKNPVRPKPNGPLRHGQYQ